MEKNYISFEDLDKIEVICSKKVLQASQSLMSDFSKSVGFSYKDILIALGLMQGKYSFDIEKKCFEFLTLEKEHEKQLFLGNNPELTEDFIKEVIEYKENLLTGFSELPKKFTEWILNSSEKEDLSEKFYNCISLATRKDKDTLENTDIYACVELFFRIFMKPNKDLEKALFLNNLVETLKMKFQSSRLIQTVKGLI